MENLTWIYGSFLAAGTPTQCMSQGYLGFEFNVIFRPADKASRFFSDGIFWDTTLESKAESADEHHNLLGTPVSPTTKTSVCFIKNSKNAGKQYPSSTEKHVGTLLWSSWLVRRYPGTSTVNPDFRSARSNVTARIGGTTDRILDRSLEVQACCPILDSYDQYPYRCSLNFSKEMSKSYESMVCYSALNHRSMAFVYSQTECCYWYNGMMMRGREQRVNPNAKDTYSLKEENTTVFLYEYSTTSICIERASDLFDEELSLLKDEANNELHENISEGSSFRIVWVKTDHPGDQACLLQSGDPK